MIDNGISVAFVLGTRPEIIKLAPVVRECQRRDWTYTIVHTGQHYSDSLDSLFFDQLDIPAPDYRLNVGSDSHGRQTAAMLSDIEPILKDERPAAVLVQGDTNSTLAGSLAASKLDTALGHVEAGLRSFNRDMPEEINRVLSDHAADLLFAPTSSSRQHLLEEGISDDRVHVTGNTIVDAVREHTAMFDARGDVLPGIGLSGSEYVLLTAHRAENVDDPERFRAILDGVARFAAERGVDCIYPAHPRAAKNLSEFDIDVPDEVIVVDPLDFFAFLALEDDALVVFTDSGGVQEETAILGTPCVTVRDDTERPETLHVGANCLTGADEEQIVEAGHAMADRTSDWSCPFGDGNASERILDVLAATEGEPA